MKRNNINAVSSKLSTDELMSCYQAAYDKMDPEDQDTVIACVDRLMRIKNMGIASAWELTSKLGIYLINNKNTV